MKKKLTFFSIFFVSVGLMYSAEVTLGFGWRISDSGLVLGENSFPLTVNRIEEYEENGKLYRDSEVQYYTKNGINSFQRKGYIVFGIDLFRSHEKVSLGLELSVGYIERNYQETVRHRAEIVGEQVFYDVTDEIDVYPTKIIPVNLFLVAKYKFNRIQGWLRPYFGVGGGLSAKVFIDGLDDSLKDSDV